MDRPLYFACRDDRERFCASIVSGNGKVCQCLLQHKMEKEMSKPVGLTSAGGRLWVGPPRPGGVGVLPGRGYGPYGRHSVFTPWVDGGGVWEGGGGADR